MAVPQRRWSVAPIRPLFVVRPRAAENSPPAHMTAAVIAGSDPLFRSVCRCRRPRATPRRGGSAASEIEQLGSSRRAMSTVNRFVRTPGLGPGTPVNPVFVPSERPPATQVDPDGDVDVLPRKAPRPPVHRKSSGLCVWGPFQQLPPTIAPASAQAPPIGIEPNDEPPSGSMHQKKKKKHGPPIKQRVAC